MFKSLTTTALSTAMVAALTSPAAANHLGELWQHVGQVRSQMALLEAQTAASFNHLPNGRRIADDVYDELEDLCRWLDRFERELNRPVVTRGQLRRLEIFAERVDAQACDVQEALADAIHDANRRSARTSTLRTVHRHAQLAQRAYPVPQLSAQQLAVYPGVTRRAVAQRGVNVSFGNVRFSFGNTPRVTAIPARQIVGRTAVPHQAFRASHISHAAPACLGPGEAAALQAQAQQLRFATKLLLGCVCD